MTTNKLDEIEGRLKAATPEPWKWDCGVMPPDGPETYADIYADDGDLIIAQFNDQIPEGRANARLITNAPTDISYLLSRVRELEAERDAWKNDAKQWEENTTLFLKERDRLRAILEAPVTDEVITAMHDAMVEWGVASVPSYRCLEGALKAAIAARRSK